MMKNIEVFVRKENSPNSAGATFASPPLTPKQKVTFCWRFYEESLSEGSIFSSYATKEDHPEIFFKYGSSLLQFSNWKYKKGIAKFAFFFNFVFLNSTWPPKKWHHVCFSYDHSKRETILVSRGTLVYRDKDRTPKDEKQIPNCILKNLHLMRSSKGNGMVGKLTDFNIWNFAMPVDEMKNWTLCMNNKKGNIVDWDTMDWIKEALKEEVMTQNELCEEPNPGMMILPGKRIFKESIDICKRLGGSMHYASNSTKAKDMFDFIGQYEDECPDQSLFTGLTDIETEGVFINEVTNETVNEEVIEWNWGEPNGGRYENCVDVSRQGYLNDRMCDTPTDCTLCHFKRRPAMKLRGICSIIEMDRNYVMDFNEKKSLKYVLSGWGSNIIMWSNTNSAWELFDTKLNLSVASTNRTRDYPIGTQEWHFTNIKCNNQNENFRKMNLHSCPDDLTPCEDGSCITLEQTCDQIIHCPDGSDEIGCSFMDKDEHYNKDEPPPSKGVLNVAFNLTIDKVTKIDEQNGLFGAKITLFFNWYDRRITYYYLKENMEDNVVPKSSRGYDIWVPEIVFHNTKDAISSSQIDSDSYASVVVQRKGHYKKNTLEYLWEMSKYDGSENPLVKQAFYSIEFECDFDISNYPFDTQTCFILISPDFSSHNLVNFTTGLTSVRIRNFSLEDFHLLASEIFQGQSINQNLSPIGNGIKVSIKFQRNPFKVFMKTYLPTTMINLINLATNFYHGPDMLEAIVTVNLTSLMVLVSLFISVLESLPSGSSISLIEFWLLFNLIIPFTIVILHTIIYYQQKQMIKVSPTMYKENDFAMKGIFIGRYIVPALFALFVCVYWAYGLLLLS